MPYQRSTRYPELFKKDGSSRWWCYLPNPNGGKQLREPTGHIDERAAHAWYLERVRSAPTGTERPAKKQRSLVVALADRLEWLKSARAQEDKTRKKLSEDTIEFYLKKGKPLVRILGANTLLSEIGHEEIRRYIVQRTREEVKANTIGKELTALSMAMRLARKDGVECSAFADVKPEDFASVYVPKERWLSEGEVDALIAVLPPKRAAVVAFIVATSATYPSEVAPVTRAMVDETKYVVRVPGKKREARDRTLRVPSHARRFLDFALEHASGGPGGTLFEPWSNVRRDLHVAAGLLSMCKQCRETRIAWARHEAGATKPPPHDEGCKRCKLVPRFEPLSPNDLRRTFAQWLVRSGVPYELAYPMMGHNSPRMLEKVYGKRDATAVADLVELALKKAPRGARRKTA